jgi:hypothetical protein
MSTDIDAARQFFLRELRIFLNETTVSDQSKIDEIVSLFSAVEQLAELSGMKIRLIGQIHNRVFPPAKPLAPIG